MMKKFILSVTGLLLVGCTQPIASPTPMTTPTVVETPTTEKPSDERTLMQSTWTTYTNSSLGFQIDYPKPLKVMALKNDETLSTVVFSQRQPGAVLDGIEVPDEYSEVPLLEILVHENSTKVSFEAWCTLVINSGSSMEPEACYGVRSEDGQERSTVTINGLQWIKFTQPNMGPEYILMHATRVYVVQFPVYWKLIDRAVESFKIIER